MQAIKYLSDWIPWLLILFPVGGGAMISYQAFRKTMSNDISTAEECNEKITNTLKGSIIGTTIAGTITVLKSFYGF